jgi:hypothetical protein
MATDDQVQKILNVYYDGLSCDECGASVRIGEYECAHCGADFEVLLRQWATRVADRLTGDEDESDAA